MWDVKACAVCFGTECVLYKLDNGPLKQDYFWISGIKSGDMDGIPQYLCAECSACVLRFRKFRDKCKRAHFAMKQLVESNKQITTATLEAIDRKALKIAPIRSFLELNKTHYETVQFIWDKDTYNRGSINSVTLDETIPVFYCSTVALECEFEPPNKRPRLTTNSSDAIKLEVEVLPEELTEINHPNQIHDVPSASVPDDDDDYFNNDYFEDEDNQATEGVNKDENAGNTAEGTILEEEYATMIPISMKESKAAAEVYKMFRKGDLVCRTCNNKFSNKALYAIHLRMHDQHVSGNFHCVLCQTYYKTDFLLKTHMTDKHMYKYICRKCPEVNFDRISAKQHYIWTHLQKGSKKAANWYESRPSWLRKAGGNRNMKGIAKLRPVRKITKLPDDFLIYTPISQEEQYRLVQERKNTRNYLEASFKCEFCYKGFREAVTYGKHMKKHDPAVSGAAQCDMCKLHFRDARKVYKHMIITHLFKYSCQVCNYSCYNKGQAHMHYRWHKNVTYTCQYCNKVFTKASTRLTHIRIKHPSTIVCGICGHSFVSESGLYCHKKLAHSKEEIEHEKGLVADPSDLNYCADCKTQFLSATAYKTHLGSSSKHATTNVSTKPVRLSRPSRAASSAGLKRGRPRNASSEIVNNGVPTSTHCEICNKFLSNDVQARKHYETEHPGADFLKRYMCDVCGHTTRQYANLMVHMRTHTQEKPYGCPHCDRRFSMPSNRDRHIVVHTGEKKYQCQHCSRRFTQSSAVKLHIQTVHLKIPYAPWDKKNRKRRKELEGGAGPVPPAPPQPKLLLDPQGNYLSAYITYNDE